MTIFIDTREQLPINQVARPRTWVSYVKRTLSVGDYTTDKLLKKFVIERKSPQDLYGTLTKGHRRFRKELGRAEKANILLVIYVECKPRTFYNKKYVGAGYQQEVSGDTLKKIIHTMNLRYELEFVWCKDRKDTANKIINRLQKEQS